VSEEGAAAVSGLRSRGDEGAGGDEGRQRPLQRRTSEPSALRSRGDEGAGGDEGRQRPLQRRTSEPFDGAIPDWYLPFADLPAQVRAIDLSRFIPEAGGGHRRAAILVLLGESGTGPDVLLTQRSSAMRAHPGQVSFPGGTIDSGEQPEQAAIREAVEETGLDATGVQITGLLPDVYLPVSDFAVTPVIAWWHTVSAVGPVDPAEVARVARVPLAELAEPENRFRVRHPSGYVGPGFAAGGLFVWGFTAGLLDRLLAITGWERPWNPERYRPVPDDDADRGWRVDE
jgi:8-oxo-dGTP pyrophosphatase MutT (NUDIX family)